MWILLEYEMNLIFVVRFVVVVLVVLVFGGCYYMSLYGYVFYYVLVFVMVM